MGLSSFNCPGVRSLCCADWRTFVGSVSCRSDGCSGFYPRPLNVRLATYGIGYNWSELTVFAIVDTNTFITWADPPFGLPFGHRLQGLECLKATDIGRGLSEWQSLTKATVRHVVCVRLLCPRSRHSYALSATIGEQPVLPRQTGALNVRYVSGYPDCRQHRRSLAHKP